MQEAPEPTKREFERVLADERLGVPIEDALEGARGGWSRATSSR